MFIIIKDGRCYGYKYTCPACTSEYIATHNEEKRTPQNVVHTTCPVCGKDHVWAQTSKEINCSDIVKPH